VAVRLFGVKSEVSNGTGVKQLKRPITQRQGTIKETLV
jgi:hypothetical protein